MEQSSGTAVYRKKFGQGEEARSLSPPAQSNQEQRCVVKSDASAEESKKCADDGVPDRRALGAQMSDLEKWIQDRVTDAVYCSPDSLHRSLLDPVRTCGSDSSPLVLEFLNKLPSIIFTGQNIVAEDSEPIKIRLVHRKDNTSVAAGPLSQGKIEIVVLDGDFGCQKEEEYWTKNDFNSHIIRARSGRRPLLTGELSLSLREGLACLGPISFTDNSSWIRSRRFRLGARTVQHSPNEHRIREARSESFVVKDHRGESYKKHYPPRLLDEVCRLEKISRSGAVHQRLNERGISSVKDFLRLYERDAPSLRKILGPSVSERTWKAIVKHATSCVVEDSEYYRYHQASQTPGLLFNSVHKVVGATFDGQSFLSLEKLTLQERHLVETMKQQALQNLNDLYPVHATSPLALNPSTNFEKEPVGMKMCLQTHNVFLPQHDSKPTRSTEPKEHGGRGYAVEAVAGPRFATEALLECVNDSVQTFQDEGSICLPSLSLQSGEHSNKVIEKDDFDLMLISEDLDASEIPPRTQSECNTDNLDREIDSCYTDSDTEDERVTRVGRKHQKLTVSESFHQDIQMLEVQMQACPGVIPEEECPAVEMPIDANVEYKKTEAARQCAEIDDLLSWELFCQNAGGVVDDVEIQKMAIELVQACGCDSRSIILMARALNDVWEIETWEYALESLSLQHASGPDDPENLLVNVLKLSIELLEDDVARECLKSFVMHSKNSEVAKASLINRWIRDRMLTSYSEGENVIENLLDSKLLESSENGELVKFPELGQYSVDLIFQPEEGGEFLMQGGLGLVEPPEVEEWERAKVICLMHNGLSELPESPRCPSLSTLFLQRNHKLRTIPPSFFSHMPALEVLNLSRTRIKSLPDSLFELISLKRLFLNECILLRRLSAKVGELKNLEVLDLEGTKLVGLPKEIEQLVKLTCLEFSILGSASRKLCKEADPLIPSGVLSSLSRIEELNVDVCPDADWWDSCVEDLFSEICSLARLSTLKFYFPKVELMGQIDATSLTHFKIVVGRHIGRIMSRLPPDIEFELERWDRYLKYIHGEGVPEGVMKVLKLADAFFLDRQSNVKKLSDFGKENLEQLRCCVLGEGNELQVLIDAQDFHEESERITLQSLEFLYVHYMKNLETIWRGPVQKGSLSGLKSLTLRTCPKLTSIFTKEVLENLYSLEELTVEDCPALISLISCSDSAHSETLHYLPLLRKMSLHYLPELSSISGGLQVALKIEWLSLYDCPNLTSLGLSVQEVKRIKGQRSWWEGLKWTGGRPDDLFVAISESAVP